METLEIKEELTGIEKNKKQKVGKKLIKENTKQN